MRYKNYNVGCYRKVIKFLFLPKKLKDEWRWLEFACIRQRYGVSGRYSGVGSKITRVWFDVSWDNY